MRTGGRTVACSLGSVDPTSAAGVTMDLDVFRAFKVEGVAAVAGLTAQNSRRVYGLRGVPARFVRRELEAIWEQVEPRSLCVGLLPDVDVIRTVRSFLRALKRRPAIVIDPVIAASSGQVFLGEREVRELRTLLPLATIVTPNAREAAHLASQPVNTLAQARSAALALGQLGCAALVTGGHLRGAACVDVLAVRGSLRQFSGARIDRTLRGSGGILAASIAACLARGMSLSRSVLRARAFVRRAFARAAPLGSGKPQRRS